MFEFFADGSIFLCGERTEKQGGCILGISTEQGIKALAAPNGTDTIHIEYEDSGSFDIEIGDCEPRAEEAETPAALVRGIMNCFIESGNIFGGFDAKISSSIPPKSGIFQEAAFEVLIGRIISGLFFGNTVPALNIARFGSIAENEYFGGPCGIAGQLISAAGGLVFADFSDPDMPQYTKIDFDFGKSGYTIALIENGNETQDFSDSEKEMAFVAWNMGYTALSEAEEAEFIAQFPILRQKCGEKAVMQALRFYEEKRKAEEEAEALGIGDFDEFLRIYENSGAKPKILLEENAGAFAEEMEKEGFGVLFVI